MLPLLVLGALTVGSCGGVGRGGPAACPLPRHTPPAPGFAPTPDAVASPPAGCTVVLGERDSGRRLVVEPGTTLQVQLPDDGSWRDLGASPEGETRPLRAVQAGGLDATFQAAGPGLAAIEAAPASTAAAGAQGWRVEIEVRGLTLTAPVFTSAQTAWARRGPSMIDRGVIVRSGDGGLDWVDVTPHGLAPGSFTVLDAVTDTIAWVGMQGRSGGEWYQRVWTTDDGGLTWTPSPMIGPGQQLVDVSAIDGVHAWLLLTDANDPFQPRGLHVMRTSDGGRSWQEVAASEPGVAAGPAGPRNDCQPRTIAFADAATGYLTGDACLPAYLEVTRDGGQTWTPQSLPVPPGAPADAVAAGPCHVTGPAWTSALDGRLVLVCDGPRWPGSELYLTGDGGATWQPVPLPGLAAAGHPAPATPGPPAEKPQTADVLADFVDARHAWAWSEGRLLATTDGGSTWTSLVPSADTLRSLQFVTQSTGFAFDPGTGTFRRSDDAGRTWTPLPSPSEVRTTPTPWPQAPR